MGRPHFPAQYKFERPYPILHSLPYIYIHFQAHYHVTLKMEASRANEIIYYDITTRHHNPVDDDFNLHRHENLKSHIKSK
jgi:hypothetical protein